MDASTPTSACSVEGQQYASPPMEVRRDKKGVPTSEEKGFVRSVATRNIVKPSSFALAEILCLLVPRTKNPKGIRPPYRLTAIKHAKLSKMATAANKLKTAKIYRLTAINKMEELFELATSARTETSLRTLFRMRHVHVLNIYDDFYEHHNNILSLVAAQEGSDINAEEQKRVDFDHKFYSVEAFYDELFGLNPPNLAPNNSHGTLRGDNVKLPKINIPIFSGDLLSWPTFYGLFKSLIHENISLSNCEKFHYLLSYLDKEPLLLVKNLPVTNENYITAYNTLLQRYQNKRFLASHYFDKLVDISKTTCDNPRLLRNLIDTFNDNVNALKNLGYSTDSWDFVLFRLLIRKIDPETIKRFELQFDSKDDPSYAQLTEFLTKQCSAFESVSSNFHSYKEASTRAYKRFSNNKISSTLVANVNNSNKCSFCNNNAHVIYNCPTFLAKTPKERYDFIKQKRFCTNCLGNKHSAQYCNSSSLCRMCRQKHHSLLHFNISSGGSDVSADTSIHNNPSTSQGSSAPPHSTAVSHISVMPTPTASFSAQVNSLTNSSAAGTVLLSTALVEVLNVNKQYEPVRILLDSASQLSFVTEKCAKRLGLPHSNLSLSVHGLGQLNACSPKKSICCKIRPKGQEDLSFNVVTAILPKICGDMPTFTISPAQWEHLSNLKLADPTFHISSSVDMLLGADVFSLLLRNGRLSGAPGEPSALNTIFGWVMMGKVDNTCISTFMSTLSSFFVSSEPALDETLKKFWELEEIPHKSLQNPDDVLCEKIFMDTHFRDSSGRFIVNLPFRSIEPILVAPPHQDYQRILWRFSPDEDVQSYRLKTVTYGVSSSPFLAIRTLLQLAHEGQDKFPLASEAISKFTYVDDVICSCKSLSEANRLRSELVVLLESGGFHLRKWASNNSIFLSSIPPEECQQNSLSFDSQDYSIKILGLIWDPSNDHFKYNIAPLDRPCTKRTILSELARIFDPLGFITPLTFFAKHLIQHLWTLGLQWDEVPPAEVLQVWLQYKKELKLLSDISVPRHVTFENFSSVELHGFADNSMVVLSWIRSSPHRWTTFVSNRVSHIQDNVSSEHWHHVPTHENPSDCASRGLLPSQLVSHHLWWSGPQWLSDISVAYPSTVNNRLSPDALLAFEKEKRNISLPNFVSLDALNSLLDRFSSLPKIKRIVAYILRFLHNLRHPLEKRRGAFTHVELHEALMLLVKRVQYFAFSKEMSALEENLPLSKAFRKLAPFLKDDVLRVGGRLFHSGLSYDHKHPAILPRNHRLTELIIEDMHRQYMHPGPQTLQFLLTQQFWILNPRRAIPVASEFLEQVAQRWDKNAPPIEPGMLVLIKNEQEPPLHWRLGRVLHTHPGRDGIIRVVTLNTARGQLQRPVAKLCPLPIY
ncbi:hypothetical protein NQ317_011913 [Molorchus minor]|uniref:DUF5641 domain-containing protein n=1 Tax=Molorchus minor TaxID=1323400 RepID=A0ABQ9JJQ6_9CUCU|nr:hypothetical protein NQ317_011913 [Molorchus minor]